MNREDTLGIILVALLLGGLLLLSRRHAITSSYASIAENKSRSIKLIPVSEPRRYQNKEIREVEYNDNGLPVKIIITRDYAVT